MTSLPTEITAALPDGYTVRWKPPSRGVIGPSRPWLIEGHGMRHTVADPNLILPTIRAHIAAGQPDSPARPTRRQAREASIIADAARMPLEQVARCHHTDMTEVLHLIRKPPRFTDSEPTHRRWRPGRAHHVHFE